MPEDFSSLAHTSPWVYLAIGVGAAIGSYRILSHILDQSKYELRYCAQQSLRHKKRIKSGHRHLKSDNMFSSAITGASEDLIGDQVFASDEMIEALAQLSQHSYNFRLREMASQLFLDTAMRSDVLAMILDRAERGPDRHRMVVLLQILAQMPDRVPRLVRAGVLRVLVRGLGELDDKELSLRSAAALVDLLGDNDSVDATDNLRKAADCGILEAVALVLLRTTAAPDSSRQGAAGSSEDGGQPAAPRQARALLVAVCVAIAKMYALQTAFHGQMIDLAYLPALLSVAKHAAVDLELLRATMETIVRLCTYLGSHRSLDGSGSRLSTSDANPQIAQLLELGAVDLVVACIRQDDQSVFSWGIGFLHEFLSRGVGKQQLAESPGIVRWLCRRLCTPKYAYTNQLILRSLWCLCTTSRRALLDVTQPPNLRRILSMFANDDDADVQYWSIVLISDASVYPSTHIWILSSPLPRAFSRLEANLAPNLRVTLLPKIGTIINRLCLSISLAPLLATHGEIAQTCRSLMASDVEAAHMEVIYAFMNAASTSQDFLRMAADKEVIDRMFSMLASFGREQAQRCASKGLISLMYAGILEPERIVFPAVHMFLYELNHLYKPIIKHERRRLSPLKDTAEEPSLTDSNIAFYLLTADILLSAVNVFVAKQGCENAHFLTNRWVGGLFCSLRQFQMNQLAHIASLLARYVNLEIPYTVSEEDESEKVDLARVHVDTVVTAFYVWQRMSRDPHCEAAVSDCEEIHRTIRHVVSFADEPSKDMCWLDNYDYGRYLSRSNGRTEGKDSEFPVGLQDATLRCMLPVLLSCISMLTDTLSDVGLDMQSPVVTRLTLWLMRILYYVLPPSLRGIVIRPLSMINVLTLSRADAAGLLGLCTKYMGGDYEQMAGSLGSSTAEQQHPVSGLTYPERTFEECVAWQEDAAVLGVTLQGGRSAEDYFDRNPRLHPDKVRQSALFHAQMAIDRYVGGWHTSVDLYSCIDAPPSAGGSGDLLSYDWFVDRSGPRGSAFSAAPVVLHDPVPLGAEGLDVLGDDRPLNVRPPSPFPVSMATAGDVSSPSSSSGGGGGGGGIGAAMAAVVPRGPSLAGLLGGTQRHWFTPVTPSFLVLGDGRTVWNPGWKFESVRARSGIDGRLGGVHRFKVRLLTDDRLQIGWCTNACGFYPENGKGVGDDYESVSYDGRRLLKWHGPADAGNAYGERWQVGDIIVSELDLDNDRVTFYRNGRSLGLAFGTTGAAGEPAASSGFQGLSRDRTWYPAVSMAVDQGVVFLGVGDDDDDDVLHIDDKERDDGQSLAVNVNSDITSSINVDEGDEEDCLFESNQPKETQHEQQGSECCGHEGPSMDSTVDLLSAREMDPAAVVCSVWIRFGYQDLDAYPCVSLLLPSDCGTQIIVGPAASTNGEDLFSYLQPQWWAILVPSKRAYPLTPEYREQMSQVCPTAASVLAWRFAELIRERRDASTKDSDAAVYRSLGSGGSVVPGLSWIRFVVLRNGRVFVTVMPPTAERCGSDAAGSDVDRAEVAEVTFDVGVDVDVGTGVQMNRAHVWLPVVSSSVVDFAVKVDPVPVEQHVAAG
ncbi:hypothetical protein GGI07_001962 [Coemansia sp. Benny D115]|nr:hypothetical protein GGI07_001962 [Coemansia sp. Benny D115]